MQICGRLLLNTGNEANCTSILQICNFRILQLTPASCSQILYYSLDSKWTSIRKTKIINRIVLNASYLTYGWNNFKFPFCLKINPALVLKLKLTSQQRNAPAGRIIFAMPRIAAHCLIQFVEIKIVKFWDQKFRYIRATIFFRASRSYRSELYGRISLLQIRKKTPQYNERFTIGFAFIVL